ncbi:MAG: GDP-mannose 4,6-dehydratase [Bacteroidales bacterium]
MKTSILITGVAGFIGYFLTKKLFQKNSDLIIVGIDNLNDYYDTSLKKSRLKQLLTYSNFIFVEGDISNKETIQNLFNKYSFTYVVNLAAQAGVRYSIDHPDTYIQSNIVGFFNLLEACRHHSINHFVFASSSSIYGANKKVPYSTGDKTDCPVSLYAATKKTDELLGYAYSKLYNTPMTGLRFFTVYGPMGRPDMAYFKFTNSLIKGETIDIYNNGDMFRDFTYIDDIVEGIARILFKIPSRDANGVLFKVYNIGNNHPDSLLTFVSILEQKLIKYSLINKEGKKRYLPMQPGDVYQTYADVSDLLSDFNWKPSTTLEDGLEKFVKWYKEYFFDNGNK